MLGKFTRSDFAHTVFFFALFKHIDHAAAAGFVYTISVAAHCFSLFRRFVGDFFREAEVERIHRAGLDAEGLLVFADAITAHGAFARLAGDVVFGNDLTGKASKCTMCSDRISEDKQPFCVQACPVNALDFGFSEEIADKATKQAEAVGGYTYGVNEAGGGSVVYVLKESKEKYGV